MTMAGDPFDWADLFPKGLVPDVIQLILDTWNSFKKPNNGEREPDITARFGKDLSSRNRKLDKIPVLIETEVDAAGNTPGRIDFKVTHGYRPEVYFGIEAKKLRYLSGSRRVSNASEYVGKEGMMRFITGKYSPNQEHAGMLGYVMDGKCNKAHVALNKQINNDRIKLKINANGFNQNCSQTSKQYVCETCHTLVHRKFILHHILLGV